MKKITALFFAVLLSLTAFIGVAQAAPEYDGDVEPYAVLLVDADTGAVLYSKNADETVEPASTTKIMTMIIALEQADMDSVVTVSSKAAGQGGSLLHIATGEELVMKDLLNGMMLVSGNDAAMAVAEAVGGSEEAFADLMNAKAQELGMAHTHYVVPHGMHADNHYTTASDMAILTEYAMKNPDFAQIVSQASYTMPADNKHSETWEVKNTNKLLQSDDKYYYKYATGIKTGSTPAAGDCLISSATKGDMNLICLVFKDEFNGTKRWPLSADLFEFGFENFRTLDMQAIFDAAAPVSVPVQNAAEGSQTVSLGAQNAGEGYRTFEKAVADKIEAGALDTKVTLTSGGDALTAPVNAGDQVGTIDYLDDTGNTVYQGILLAQESVAAAGAETAQAGASPDASGTQSAVTQAPGDPQSGGVGTLGWILIAVGGVLLVLIILFGILLIMRKKRYARRRTVKRRRPAQRPGPRPGR